MKRKRNPGLDGVVLVPLMLEEIRIAYGQHGVTLKKIVQSILIFYLSKGREICFRFKNFFCCLWTHYYCVCLSVFVSIILTWPVLPLFWLIRTFYSSSVNPHHFNSCFFPRNPGQMNTTLICLQGTENSYPVAISIIIYLKGLFLSAFWLASRASAGRLDCHLSVWRANQHFNHLVRVFFW